MIAGAAAQKFTMGLSKEQEILGNIADLAIQTYLAESVLLRVQKLASIKGGEDAVKDEISIMKSFFFDAVEQMQASGKAALWSFSEGDEFRGMSMGLKRFTKMTPFNVKEERRNIAAKLIDANKYCF